MEWVFSGIGAQIIGIILTTLIGALIGYGIGVKRVSKQKQIAGDFAKQRQELSSHDDISCGKTDIRLVKKEKTNQHQKAGIMSVQTQIGESNVRK